jgi:hypothetical protein
MSERVQKSTVLDQSARRPSYKKSITAKIDTAGLVSSESLAKRSEESPLEDDATQKSAAQKRDETELRGPQTNRSEEEMWGSRQEGKGGMENRKADYRTRASAGAKFTRAVDSALQYFSDQKVNRHEKVVEAADTSDLIEEENRSVDIAEYLSLKAEMQEVKKELGDKDQALLAEKRKTQKLEFELRVLRTKVQDPLEASESTVAPA